MYCSPSLSRLTHTDSANPNFLKSIIASQIHFMASNPHKSSLRKDSFSMASPSGSPPGYEPLRSKDAEAESVDGHDMLPLSHHPRRRRRNLSTVLKVLSALILSAFVILTFALSFHAVELLGKIGALVKHPKPTSHYRSYKFPCGETSAEAQAKGCVFDVMTMAWQSPECFDEDLNEEFMAQGPWDFYADQTGAMKLSYEQVAQKGQVSWTTRRYFVLHCVYAYKGLHRVWQRGWRLDSNSASAEHTEVCARVLANASMDLDALTTRIHVDFPSCN
jgi:hypothetical protein